MSMSIAVKEQFSLNLDHNIKIIIDPKTELRENDSKKEGLADVKEHLND